MGLKPSAAPQADQGRGAHLRRPAAGRSVVVEGSFAALSSTELDELMELAEADCPICNGSAEHPDHPAVIVQEAEWDAGRERFVTAPSRGVSHGR